MESPGSSKRKGGPVVLHDPEGFFVRRIEVTSLEAKRSAEQVFQGRIRTYEEIYTLLEKFIGEDAPYQCPNLTSEESDSPLWVGPRIGAPGAEGFVYMLALRDHEQNAALKVLFADSPSTETLYEEQARITENASELVELDVSPYFPLVYANVPCGELIVPPPADKDDPYWSRELAKKYDNSVTYAIKYALIEKYLPKEHLIPEIIIGEYEDWSVHRMAALAKQRYAERPFGTELKLDEFPMRIELGNVPLRGRALILELVWGDLRAYMQSPENTLMDEWNAYILIKEILTGIRDLQLQLSVLHGDLHAENILVMLVDREEGVGKRPFPLIHDFGRKAREIPAGEWNPTLEKADASRILGSIAGWSSQLDPSHPFGERLQLINANTFKHIANLRDKLSRRKIHKVSDMLEWWNTHASPSRAVEGEQRGGKLRRVRTPISATDCVVRI